MTSDILFFFSKIVLFWAFSNFLVKPMNILKLWLFQDIFLKFEICFVIVEAKREKLHSLVYEYTLLDLCSTAYISFRVTMKSSIFGF